jgi:radical SAM family uncharacterized protein/radical SAM-linked protein
MTSKSIQDILPLIEKPSRYLGTETNRVQKNPAKVKLKFALAFPDRYEIGTSHFGMQILYHMLNRQPNIAAERVFAPAEDMDDALRACRIPLMSLETRQALKTFDILGFSLLYELNYTNILTILELSGIPFYAAQRDASFPLIIAGGPCTCNPEPVADFFDAMVIGDGEPVILQLANLWLKHKENGRMSKSEVLNDWSKIRGVYVPERYRAVYDSQGFQRTALRMPDHASQAGVIRRSILKCLDSAPFPEAPVVPFGKPVHDRLRLEVSRGCTRGCRFCQAGMIYRPVRERSPETLLRLADVCIHNTGYEDISLLSLSTGDYSQLFPLMDDIMKRYEAKNIAVSLPSFRAGTLTPELMKMIKRVRKTGFTIAPEAGSQRLRNVINKNISEDEIVETVTHAFSLGWQVIKLYFMVGLPTETQADVDDIVRLVKQLGKIKGASGRYGKLNVSLATFIPKPHTPFQWASQMTREAATDRISRLKSSLKLPGIQVKWQNPSVSFLEGLWARGDRKLSRLLVRAFKNGCRFDGWSDRFQYARWERSFSESGIDPAVYTTRKRDLEEPLPWDHIDSCVSKAFLKKEWERALQEAATGDCRWNPCHQCGVCDFKEILPALSTEDATAISTPNVISGASDKAGGIQLCILYSKTGDAKYFGHLEMVNIFLRALRRMELPLIFSRGFHPMPRVSFEDPLPIGMQSSEERFFIFLAAPVDTDGLVERLNQELPAGLFVKGCSLLSKKRAAGRQNVNQYVVTLHEGIFEKGRLDWFAQQASVPITRTNKKGHSKTIDLKEFVFRVAFLRQNCLSLGIRQVNGKMLRPAEFLSRVFELSDEVIKKAIVIKGSVNV